MTVLSFCSIAFRNDEIAGLWRRVAEIGYDAIELFWGQLAGLDDAALADLADMGRELNCPALVISPYLCFTRGREEYDASIERVRSVVHAARILGAPKIRTFVDVGPTGVASAEADESQWQAGFEGLRTAAAMAPELTFVMETHEKTLADCAAGVDRIFANVQADNLKLLVHPDGCGDFAGLEGYRRYAGRIDHMHLKNHTADGEATWVEQGIFDHESFLRGLLTEGYTGSLSVEYCWKGATWTNAEDAHAHLRGILNRIER